MLFLLTDSNSSVNMKESGEFRLKLAFNIFYEFNWCIIITEVEWNGERKGERRNSPFVLMIERLASLV